MTVTVLDVVPAGSEWSNWLTDDGWEYARRDAPPTEWKRPCPICALGVVDNDGYHKMPWNGGFVTCDECGGEGTITVPLTCQTCDGVGHLGPATHSPQKDYGRACPDCHDGHPIIEWQVPVHSDCRGCTEIVGPVGGWIIGGHGYCTVQVSIEAVPIVEVDPAVGYPVTAPYRFVYVSTAETPAFRLVDITDPSDTYLGPATDDAKPGDYAIVATPTKIMNTNQQEKEQ